MRERERASDSERERKRVRVSERERKREGEFEREREREKEKEREKEREREREREMLMMTTTETRTLTSTSPLLPPPTIATPPPWQSERYHLRSQPRAVDDLSTTAMPPRRAPSSRLATCRADEPDPPQPQKRKLIHGRSCVCVRALCLCVW